MHDDKSSVMVHHHYLFSTKMSIQKQIRLTGIDNNFHLLFFHIFSGIGSEQLSICHCRYVYLIVDSINASLVYTHVNKCNPEQRVHYLCTNNTVIPLSPLHLKIGYVASCQTMQLGVTFSQSSCPKVESTVKIIIFFYFFQ